ncbi:hypothetical protein KKG05_02980, partial [bacterium]|nr:hypothetical protein [bacterium]
GVDDIAATGKELREFVSVNSLEVDTLVVNIKGIVNQMGEISSDLKNVSTSISDTTGTVGKLIYSDTLHNQIVRTLVDIDSLVSKLKREGVKVRLF